jgi:RNA polymerase sigma factor for flagellar operon FliA
LQRDDLASVGKLALIQSLSRVDGEEHEIRAFCYVRVRGAILDELRRQDRLSRADRGLLREFDRLTLVFGHTHGRDPSAVEAAAALKVPVGTVERVLAARVPEPGVDLDNLLDESAEDPMTSAETSDLKDALMAALSQLTPGQATAVRLFYLEDFTLEAIAEHLNVSIARVHQLRDAGVKRLRGQFVALGVWQSLVAGKHSGTTC